MFNRARPFDPKALSPDVQNQIAEAVAKGEAPCYHGGCVSCVFRITVQVLTFAGMEHCSGCRYMEADWNLPDRGIHVKLEAGAHSAQAVDARIMRT